ncbi:non-canonical purine NTP pyrophosphatase [Candidatus Woesearchaeota archaeon]|nr:non-canonical purine NTP pyrophosphatase [Candidatus Woesearchaeota archaeon]
MHINFVTSNDHKVQEAKRILEPEIHLTHIKVEYPELRSDDPCEIVVLAAKQLAETLHIPVVVEDSGFFIHAFNGFPGTCTKYVFQRIGNEGILKLMEFRDGDERLCSYQSAIGYCIPGGKPVSFLGIEEGKVALEIRGKKGWGQDPIFIPKGKTETYGELRKENDVNLFRKRSFEQLRDHLMKVEN